MGLVVLFLVAVLLVLVLGTAGLVRAIVWPRRKTLAVALARGDPSEPAELGLEAEAVTWTLTRRVESPGWMIAGRRPELPAIVVVHGHRNSRYGSLHRAARLVDFASKVVVFDLPAHGDAAGPTGRASDGGRCTLGAEEPDDVLRVIEQLGAERVVLFGSSMGAGIALAAAGRSPRCVGVIGEAPFRYWHQPVRAILRYKRYPALFVPLTGLALRLLGVRIGYDRAADAAKLACPLLLLHGRSDPVCPFVSTQRIAASAPRAQVVAFDCDTHCDLATIDEDRYRAALAAFFSGLAGDVESGRIARSAPAPE